MKFLTDTSEEARLALQDMRSAAPAVLLTSGCIALFQVAFTLYLLLLLDVALPGRNISTLVGIGLLILITLGVRAFFTLLRGRALSAIGDLIAARFAPRLDHAVARLTEEGSVQARDGAHASHDLDMIQYFLKSGTAASWIDIGGLVVSLIVLLFLHPLLALTFAVCAGIALFLIRRSLSSIDVQMPLVLNAAGQRQALAEAGRGGPDSIRALGMGRALGGMWLAINNRLLGLNNQLRQNCRMTSLAVHSLHYATLVLILSIGAWLHMNDRASTAAVIAAALLAWVGMTPVVRAADSIELLSNARQGWERLDTILDAVKPAAATVDLPAPTRNLSCEGISLGAPGARRALVQNISFQLESGDILAVLGRSGCGKSAILRGLAGAWPIPVGKVRLDGAALDQWDSDMLAQHIGYMPQTIDLLDGTIADNIARFDSEANSRRVVEAAQAAGMHDMIVRLPEGYNMRVGPNGRRLSLAQGQLIALARAFYGNPFLLVLDAPTAHLDAAGEQLFARAIEHMKERGSIIILAGTQSNLINLSSHVMMMRDGGMAEFGPREEVRARFEKRRKAETSIGIQKQEKNSAGSEESTADNDEPSEAEQAS